MISNQSRILAVLLIVIVAGSVYAEDAKVKNGGVRIAQIVDFKAREFSTSKYYGK